jgi:urease accessory protein
LEVSRVRHRSVATRLVSNSPLKLIPTAPFHSECRIFTSSYGGGILQHDQIDFDILCQEKAELVLQSQGNQHCYSGIGQNHLARQNTRGQIREQAKVCIIPEPTVMHAGARFHQSQIWNLHPQSQLILLDGFHSGRSENGENFSYDFFQSDIEFQQNGRTIYLDQFRSEPQKGLPTSASRFGSYSLMFNLYSYGQQAPLLHQSMAKNFDSREAHRISELPQQPPSNRPHFFCATAHDEESGITTTRVMAKHREHAQAFLGAVLAMTKQLLSN